MEAPEHVPVVRSNGSHTSPATAPAAMAGARPQGAKPGALRSLRVALDVRLLQESLRAAPTGGIGGVGRYQWDLLRVLLRREERPHLVLLVESSRLPAPLRRLVASADRVSVHDTGLPSARLRRLRYRRPALVCTALEAPFVARDLRAARADLVHFLDQPPVPVARCRVVATVYDLGAFQGLARTAGTVTGRYLMRWLHQRMRGAGAVVCISRFARNEAQRLLGIESRRLHVIYPGIDTSLFHPDGTAASATVPELRGRRFFLHVGILLPRKNPEGLLRAFARLARDHDEIDLVCVGPYHLAPDTVAHVHGLARGLGIESRVHIGPGPFSATSDARLAACYRASAGLVFPSLHEGFGFPVLEALACGTPVAMSEAAALPEADGGLALRFDPRDDDAIDQAMRRLLTEPAVAERASREGPAWAARFSWDRTAGTLLQIYEQVASSNPP